MSKKFRYTKFTGHYFCKYSDEWEEDGVEFDYEVEDKDLVNALVDFLYEEYFDGDEQVEKMVKNGLAKMLEENDLTEMVADAYEETLKDIFKKEALEFYED